MKTIKIKHHYQIRYRLNKPLGTNGNGAALFRARRVAEAFTPLPGQGAQAGPQDLGRQIGRLAPVGEQEEAAVLDDQLQALNPLRGALGDPEAAVLGRVAGGSPTSRATGRPASSTIWRR